MKTGPGTGRRGPHDSCNLPPPRSSSLPPLRTIRETKSSSSSGRRLPGDDDDPGDDWAGWEGEDWNEYGEEEELEHDPTTDGDDEGEDDKRPIVQRSKPPKGGGRGYDPGGVDDGSD